MEINKIPGSHQVGVKKSSKKGQSSQSSTGNVTGAKKAQSDSTQISQQSQVLRKAKVAYASLGETTSVNGTDKLNAIGNAVKSGNYNPDPSDIADKMVEHLKDKHDSKKS